MLERMNMKGISAIIATVLLVAFTVAVAGILSMWATTLTVSQTQTVSNQSSGQALCSPGLVIDEVRVNSTHAIVTYHNAGNQIISGVKVLVKTNTTINSTDAYSVAPGATAGTTTLTAGQPNAVVIVIIGTQDYVRVTGTCASTMQLVAECKSSEKCWKTM
jgi:flagellin-like protein